VHQVG